MAEMQLGVVQGVIDPPEELRAYAERLAAEFYREQEASSFSGDQVATAGVPDRWLRNMGWLPLGPLRDLGLEPSSLPGEFVMTADTDKHIDDIGGFTLFWVLHNDGLTFKQGRNKNQTRVGEWFVFDDRKPHEVTSRPTTTTYLGWAVPLRECN